jgi:crotonobetainyl-CoA:carnitine CoA-transferase CaiB-like acyl-CoA transferase
MSEMMLAGQPDQRSRTEPADAVTNTALDACLDGLGLSRADAGGEVSIVGSDPAIDSPHRLGSGMAVAAAAQGTALGALWRMQTGQGQDVSVDVRDAAHAVHPSRYLKQHGYPIGFDFTFPEPGNGYFKTADGRWVYLVSTRPHLRNQLLQLFDCANELGAIAASVSKWKAADLEDACALRGLPVSMVRSPEEWRTHPHGRALLNQPLIEIERIGDGAPKLWKKGKRPLSGLRALDLSHILAGPGLTRTLAEQDADVLRISAPRQTDPINFMLDTGWGKRSAFLNFDLPGDVERALRLAREADVVVQSYSPGSLAARGLSMERLLEGHPGLIYVSLSCFGDCGGPWSQRVGFDHNAQSTTGISWVEGGPDSPRLPPTTLVADYITAYLGTAGALTALLRRAREGGSYHVKVSLARTCMWVQDLGYLERRGVVNSVPPATFKMDGPFGELEYLAPITRFSATPASWNTAPQPFGAARAAWSAE